MIGGGSGRRAGAARGRRRAADRGRRTDAAVAALLLTLGLAACRFERTEPPGALASEVPDLAERAVAILDAQAAAWNAGDLDGFMAAYEPSPATTYIGATGLITGYDRIRARYAPLFEPGAARDSLRFESLDIRELDPRFGVVTARYVLHRGGEVTSTGPFTLVMMLVEGEWRIVHDQSAADPVPQP